MSTTYQHTRILSFALIGLLLAGVSGCSNEDDAQVVIASDLSVAVRATPVTAGIDALPLRFAGVVRARQRAQLTFQVGGVLRNRAVDIGQSVTAGQILATLYNPELEPTRNAARARLEELATQADQAEREAQRADQLFERGVISAQQLEQQTSRVDALNAGVGSARATLKQTEQLSAESQLRAPFSGRIETLLVEPGEFVAPGQVVMRLASNDGLEVEVSVPAHLMGELVVGQAVPVWSSLTGRQEMGRLLELGQGASQAGVLYPMVISLESSDFRTGDAVEVGVERNMGNALRVPLAAVMRSAAGLAVFQVTEEGNVRRVAITVYAMQGEQAILGEGTLKQGDQVVYAGLTRLADGDAVELLP
ncbi:MAG: RND family efflux transporter MFP subunit [Halopseudomonas sp.]|jgi:RND family efflux transporter MFP subunit|uniref:efflux RND transporter periplasmic adaptor subunit n=1 Tax=Halopseudomonas sp. TaxID=2901191 RepID=UPI0039E2767E